MDTQDVIGTDVQTIIVMIKSVLLSQEVLLTDVAA
jgi:hypothetical protein